MILATRMIHIHLVFLYNTFQRMLLYDQNGRVSIVVMEKIYSSKSSASCFISSSKTAVTNTYYWSNLGNLDCR